MEAPPAGGGGAATGSAALFLHSADNSSGATSTASSSSPSRPSGNRNNNRGGWNNRRGGNFSRGRQAQFDDNRRQFVDITEEDWRSDHLHHGGGQQPQRRRGGGGGRGHSRGQWTSSSSSNSHHQHNHQRREDNSNLSSNQQFHMPPPQRLMDVHAIVNSPSSSTTEAHQVTSSLTTSTSIVNGGAAILAAISNNAAATSMSTNPFSVQSSSSSSSTLNPNAPSFQPRNSSSSSTRRSAGGNKDQQQQDVHGRSASHYRRGPNRNFDNLRMGGGGPVAPLEEEEEAPPPIVFRVRKKADAPAKTLHKNQRENLMEQLERNAYDCMICVERVKRFHPVWACAKCFNVFHLNCLRKWANSSADEVGWRCPGCQSYSEEIPSVYYCFCGAVKNPPGNVCDVPHCCGGTCGKALRGGEGGEGCAHTCTIPCHPGPCPQCESVVKRRCPCGKTEAQVKCSSKAVVTCSKVCDKVLSCASHRCAKECHTGECPPCDVKIQLACFCGSEKKQVPCTLETLGVTGYTCKRRCGKALKCGNHECPELCHAGICRPCRNSPDVVLSCPCGQTSIKEACASRRLPQRTSCLDEIPTCGKICRRILQCGDSLQEAHRCQAPCHLEPRECPPCQGKSQKKCRCGNKTFQFPCASFNPREDVLCEKKCAKKRNCGKHKCNVKCCIDADHICPIVCDRQLRCGNHNCALLCHNGHCPPCRNVSFEELACECGEKVIYPPVPCGTRPPPCTSPCPREHDCDHPVLHHCHSDPQCPPCTVLTEKWCNGRHELRKNVMCHIKQLSCGMPCRKRLPCGRHGCVKTCHVGICLTPGESCQLPCEAVKACGHKCGAPCHEEGACPDVKCKINTDVTCECGRKKDTMVCWKREREYDRLVTYLMNLELKRLREDVLKSKGGDVVVKSEEIDPAAILTEVKETTPKTNVLECDKECARVERNRKLVEALQLKDPDVTSSFGTPNYSEFLVTYTKKNPQFVEMVHQRLTSVVLKSKTSKKKNETFAFESMNRDKRHVVHEYSDHFGCLSESFDVEPNRNVIVTASKEKSYVPQVSLVDFVFRPNLISERKNVFEDVELFQNSKSTIFRPSNGKIGSITSNSSTSLSSSSSQPPGMVALSTPIPAWGSLNSNSTPNSFSTTTTTTTLGGGSDFPALK